MDQPVKRSGSRSLILVLSALTIGLLPSVAAAHERFIPHQPRWLLEETFFRHFNPDMLNIVLRVALAMIAMQCLWGLRRPIEALLSRHIVDRLPIYLGPFNIGPLTLKQFKLRQAIHNLVAFVLDRPVCTKQFRAGYDWSLQFFLRVPALILLYAADHNSLIMPSYPLDPGSLFLFQLFQVALALAILTQTHLRLCGAALVGTLLYLLVAYDWKIAVDVLPIVAVAIVYLNVPSDLPRGEKITLTTEQIKWVRVALGASFLALGWMKLYNIYLTVGVADNFPHVMKDPMILLFYAGTSKALARECWITAFGMAEIMTGFLMMCGVFSRVWCVLMLIVFTKLMLWDFGWAELPHLFPISAFLLLIFSNPDGRPDQAKRSAEQVEPPAEQAEQPKVQPKQPAAPGGRNAIAGLTLSLLRVTLITFLALIPLLWALTWIARPPFF